MKKIGFLSFGHWANRPNYQTRTASDTLLQSIDLAVAAEEIGLDGAYFRAHHYAAQLASPFLLLSAIGAKTNKIEIGTVAPGLGCNGILDAIAANTKPGLLCSFETSCLQDFIYCPKLSAWNGGGVKYVHGTEILDYCWLGLNETDKIEACSRRYDFRRWNELESYVRFSRDELLNLIFQNFKLIVVHCEI